jgi:RNA polymerase sigma-70 factor (ECF subfamily)
LNAAENGEAGADRERLDELYRSDSRRVLATLIRLLGDFDLAEEALHEAFLAAAQRWRDEGWPRNPRAWLVSTGRFKAIDALRKRARFDAASAELARHFDSLAEESGLAGTDADDQSIGDDRLRLIFTCCHPALTPDAQLALTLREVCGLTTEEIASAFLISPPNVAQRIVRAKGKIRQAGIPYEVPRPRELKERLEPVLRVIYLIFNEGYSATSGDELIRHDLSVEAIRLGRVLVALLPESEAIGLLALMLLHDSRRAARTSSNGDLVLLGDQDRSLWNRDQIGEGLALVETALSTKEYGPYVLQAVIAALHAQARTSEATDWAQIVQIYDVLLRSDASAVIELNRAAAVAMRDDPETGLALIDSILARGELAEYHFAHSARAELLRRLGRFDEARASYGRAISLVKQAPERRFLAARLDSLR